MNQAYDAIVVGGGPAGAGTATWLARAGFHVTLLDRARFPRDKACGEFLTREACHLMQDLGAWEAVCEVGARPVAATVLVAPDGWQTRHTPPDGSPTGYALRRIALDAVLLENARTAGVEVWEGFAVRELLRDEAGRVLGVAGKEASGEPFSLRARLVVGADGSHSLVARQLNLVRPLLRLQRVALISHWRNISGPGDTIEMRARQQVVCGLGFPPHSSTCPPAPSRSRRGSEGAGIDGSPSPAAQRESRERGPESLSANLTLVVPTALAAQIAGRAGDFIEETLQTHFPDLAARLAGAEREPVIRTVGCFGHLCRPAVAEGALLVGDAATFIDPFTGEGVYFALRGAQLAAEVAAEALRADDLSRSRLLAYHRARRELARRYLLCDVVQAVVRAPALFSQVVRRLERFPGLAERLLGVLSDTRPPTDALHPGFLWRLFAPEIAAR